MEHCTRDGLTFDVWDEGPRDAEVVVLLHGWPQDHTAWHRVAPLLHDRGLRTIAPDQRGWSPGARPGSPAAYGMRELVGDVHALLDQAGVERAHLVGHDWGGSVAWAFAERHPERLRSLTVLSTPHHRAMAWAFRHGDQALRSWYMAAFQVPVLPELVLRAGLPLVLRLSGLPREDVQRYAARFREPGAATGGLNWYRALTRARQQPSPGRPRQPGGRSLQPGGRSRQPGGHRITVPTTYLWGNTDPALGRAAAERTARYVAADYRFVELEAGHWLPETQAERVAEEVARRVVRRA
jgi:pimeloyl-ACP methyl ester carboxylesterase